VPFRALRVFLLFLFLYFLLFRGRQPSTSEQNGQEKMKKSGGGCAAAYETSTRPGVFRRNAVSPKMNYTAVHRV
jgi:hypothetical protein